jgi:hypothetical protein
MNASGLVTKANGKQETFSKGKLVTSLKKAGSELDVAEEIANHIEEELEQGMSTSQIYKHAFFLLAKNNERIATRYSLRRAVMDLGPSGFPFEQYIAAIFKEKGFEVKTGQILLGGCVEHEVDIVAWNENKLVVVEAKFHNELGTRTDLKVALYVKARQDDLKETWFDYGKKRKVDEGLLITNTKFTSTAIRYAECKGLIFIGWNYPEKGNLQDMIIDSGLHPLTCLQTLSSHHKKSLLSQNIVLCKTIIEDQESLRQLHLDRGQIDTVIKEIKSLQ